MTDYICVEVSYALSLILLLIGFININPYKTKIKNLILMLLCIYVPGVIIFYFCKPIATLPIYIVPIIFIYTQCHKFLESFIIGLIVLITIILVDTLIGLALIYILGESFIITYTGFILFTALIAIVLYFSSLFVGKLILKFKNFLIDSYKSKYISLISIVLALTFAIFYFNINWNITDNGIYLSKINALLFTFYGIVMAVTCFFLLSFIKKEMQFKNNQLQLNNLKEYTENLENLYTDMRKFRHDYINIISTMASFIEDRDMDALEQHFNTHIYPLNNKINKNNYKLGLLKNIELPEIKGLISAKVIHAQELGLDIILDIIEPIPKINMDIIDLSRILGIVLDNAIEASLESDEKRVNIAFINKNASVIIVIINTFNGEIPPLSKLFKEGFSTKGDNRGLGLTNLKEIIGKYKNISLDTYIKENQFFQEITISSK